MPILWGWISSETSDTLLAHLNKLGKARDLAIRRGQNHIGSGKTECSPAPQVGNALHWELCFLWKDGTEKWFRAWKICFSILVLHDSEEIAWAPWATPSSSVTWIWYQRLPQRVALRTEWDNEFKAWCVSRSVLAKDSLLHPSRSCLSFYTTYTDA